MRYRIRRLFYPVFPPRQSHDCAGCGLALVERRRKPCPVCGSLNRVIRVGWEQGVTAQDKVGLDS